MAFKSYSLDKIAKKYTLCGLCDGKLNESPFYICGCEEILCLYCNEKHSCGFHHKAVKYDNYLSCNSISFIHDLAKLFRDGQQEKEKEKDMHQAASTSSVSCLPGLEDVMVNELSNDVSFSQLFDEVNSIRKTKPKEVYRGAKRDSISPRIAYSLKRKQQYLSDTEDESNITDQSTPRTTLRCSSSIKKRLTKRKRCRTKTRKNSLASSVCSDSDSHLIVNQLQLEENHRCGSSNISNSSTRDEEVDIDENTAVVPDQESLNKQRDSLNISNLPLIEHNEVGCGSDDVLDDHNHSNKIVKKTLLHKTETNDKLVENVKRLVEKQSSSRSSENDDSHPADEDIQNLFALEGQLNNSCIVNSLSENENEVPESYFNDIVRRYSGGVNLELNSDCNNGSNVPKKKSKNVRKFDGFNSCEINASALNYMFYKLTAYDSPCGIFPMNYKGKELFIQIGNGKVETPAQDNEGHYLLTRIGEFKSTSTQTTIHCEDAKDNKTSESVQTEEMKMKDACIGPDGSRDQEMQTSPCFFSERSVGPDIKVSCAVQTYVVRFSDASVGSEGSKPAVVQTDSYRVSDASVSPVKKITKMSQSDDYCLVNACVGSGVPLPPEDHNIDNFPHLSDEAQMAECKPKPVPLINNGCSSNGIPENNESPIDDEEIIEGTPEKANNLSFSSLDLSFLKERAPNFNMNNRRSTAKNAVICCSGLTNEEKDMVRNFAQFYGMEYADNCTIRTTHLVISTSCINETHQTFKFILAIAYKTCIVSLQWVIDSIGAATLFPAERYIPTDFAGPMRCRMNLPPPLSGVSICAKMMMCYPGVELMEHLCKVCGAFIINDMDACEKNCPFPRFFLYENDEQLTSQILDACRRNLFIPIDYIWVFDSVVHYKIQPILHHVSAKLSKFFSSMPIIDKFKIPRDLVIDVDQNPDHDNHVLLNI